MKEQYHYIIRTYWNLKRQEPELNAYGVYELKRNSGRYNLRPYYCDANKNIISNPNKKRSYKILTDLVNECDKNKRRKIVKAQPFVQSNITDIDPNNKTTTELNEKTIQCKNDIFLNTHSNSKKNINKDVDRNKDMDLESDLGTDLQSDWENFNILIGELCLTESDNWVSATKIANYLLKDPVLDWYKIYFKELQYNTINRSLDIVDIKTITNSTVNTINTVGNNGKVDSCLSVLFEMGNKFEDKVIEYLKNKFSNHVKVIHTGYVPLQNYNVNLTKQYMLDGIPIICQAPLYNELNKTFGVADLIIRSDWINKIIDSKPMSLYDASYKAPNLNGNYHYVVIDIKWTTMNLCADGERIRNSGRFPAYKGQLAIYNAIVGQLQGYTSPKSYILAKSYKYTSKGVTIQGYNCFDILGYVDYSDFDNSYLKSTQKAVEWIRNLRSNGKSWSLIPPSVNELYPNMCNSYDSGFKKQKKYQSDEIKELTSIYMVGHKNRLIGHENGIYRYDDVRCKASNLGIYGQKIAPLVNKMIQMENEKDPLIKIQPKVISNNMLGWQTKMDIEFFIDFEMLNTQFYTKEINLNNSRGISDFLFMIGVGYEENNKFVYKCFYADEVTLENENKIVSQFINFIEEKVSDHMNLYNIKDRSLCFPKLFHWSPAEKSTLKHVELRHNNKFSNIEHSSDKSLSSWDKSVTWVDFCKVFTEEPIILKGVRGGFGLKGIAKQMYENGWIETKWDESGPSDGLNAMMDACKYYKDKQNKVSMFTDIIEYNYVDCKVVWEIVNYLRSNHANETFKQRRLDGSLIDQHGEVDDDMMMFPEADEDNDCV